jgi:prolyl-tRNA editing enzyme YbaK/EbsC (Cys-tRNA(Pro) deacylase)
MMHYGTLEAGPAKEKPELLADPVAQALSMMDTSDIFVAQIDPELADTAAFCTHYEIPLDHSANCVIIEASRGEKTWLAACVILATTRADVNGLLRRHLDARKASFAPMEKALAATKMEYGGITPLGLPETMPLLIDAQVAASDWLVIGSGVRGSKLIVSGQVLERLPNTVVLENLGR